MPITLYFAKVNLESEEIYKIYKDPQKKKELVEMIYRSSNQDPHSFYEMLLKMINRSSISQKNELVEYITRRYLNT